ncbi:MAG: MarR family transcriptional regulator [Clostridia bacterium]|nr:MarR family transcriptional regulator [Clostridia bacterium]
MEEKNYDALKLENQLCFPLYAASREVIKKYRPLLETLDLTYTQYITMMVFWVEQKINVKELGRRLFLDSGTLTPVLKSLEAKGLVRRYRSAADERVLTVEITEQGTALRERALTVPAAIAACIPLEPQKAIQLYGLLYEMLDALQKEDK